MIAARCAAVMLLMNRVLLLLLLLTTAAAAADDDDELTDFCFHLEETNRRTCRRGWAVMRARAGPCPHLS